MADQTNAIDANSRPSLTAVSNSDGVTIVRLWADPITHRLLVDTGGGVVPSFSDEEIPSGAVDGNNVTFTLAHTPSPAASLELYVNGAQQWQNAAGDYTLSSATITFLSAPLTGSIILAWYRY